MRPAVASESDVRRTETESERTGGERKSGHVGGPGGRAKSNYRATRIAGAMQK